MKYLFRIIFSILIVNNPTLAQEYVFENYTTEQGLPSNQVYDIYQDDNGYLWFATDRGIARFDGSKFEAFDKSDGLTDNTVFKFYPQSDGTVWCSTFNNRLFFFNTEHYKFQEYQYNDALASIGSGIMIGDILYHKKKLWVGYKFKVGITKIDSNGRILADVAEPYKLNQKYAVVRKVENNRLKYIDIKENIDADRSHIVLYDEFLFEPSRNNHVEFDLLNNGMHFLLYDKNIVVKNDNRTIIRLNENNRYLNAGIYADSLFYISEYDKGVNIYNKNGKLLENILNGKSVIKVFKDHEGGEWFSTLNSGVFHVENPSLKKYHLPNNAPVNKIGRDRRSNIWVSTNEGAPVMYRIDKDDQFHLASYMQNEYVLDLYPVSYDEYDRNLEWNELNYLLVDGLKSQPIRGGARFDVETSTFLKTPSNVLTKNLLLNVRANDVARKNNKYILCSQEGVHIYEGGNLIKYKHPLLQERIEDIEVNESMEVYSTLGSGIVVSKNSILFNIQQKDGLNSNIINRTYFENDSVLWVCTNQGLNKVLFKLDTFSVIKNERLKPFDIIDMELVRDEIWLTTRSGLYKCDKKDFDRHNEVSLFFDITGFEINNELVNNVSKLNYDENNLKIYFRAVSFNRKLKYRYRFSENNQWNYTSNSSIIFTELPPKTYELIIEASVNNFLSSEQITLSFVISPPFYQTWWFLILVLILVSLSIYWFFKVRVLIYNKDVLRELIRLLIKKLRKSDKYIVIRESGKNIKISTTDIYYVKSSGNYLEIITTNGVHIYRHKIGDFFSLIPDPLDFVQIHRSYIVRIDQVKAVSKDSVIVNEQKLNVTKTFRKELLKIQL